MRRHAPRTDLAGAPRRRRRLGRRALDAILRQPTASVRDAAAAPGRFPVVVYHHGLGGSFDDNRVLAEELARAGFVVVASAWQPRDAGDLATDYDFARSFDDLR